MTYDSALLWPKVQRDCGRNGVFMVAGAELWNSKRLGEILAREFQQGMSATINVMTWRHVVVAVSRRHLKEGYKFKRNFNSATEKEGSKAIDMQAAHTSQIAGMVYRRGIHEAPGWIQSIRSEYRAISRAISRAWHQCLGFGIRLPPKPVVEKYHNYGFRNQRRKAELIGDEKENVMPPLEKRSKCT
jgi:hypothetical protein